jgi:hypothetical protein
MDHNNAQLALIHRYAEFIANSAGCTSICVLNGNVHDDIETLKKYILDLLPHFTISEEERKNFAILLDFNYLFGTYDTHIWCLAKCVDKLGAHSKLSKDEREAFFS